MSEENKKVELSEEQLEKVIGGKTNFTNANDFEASKSKSCVTDKMLLNLQAEVKFHPDPDGCYDIIV